FPSNRGRAQLVQAQPGDHGREEAGRIGHGRGVLRDPPYIGVLDRVLGVVDRAEHPVGDGVQQRPVLEERVLERGRPLSGERGCAHAFRVGMVIRVLTANRFHPLIVTMAVIRFVSSTSSNSAAAAAQTSSLTPWPQLLLSSVISSVSASAARSLAL